MLPSLKQGIFPTQWKQAKIIPLIKNKALPLNGPNSRPISLLPALSKMMEKICNNQIQTYLVSNHIMSDCQHAYKQCHSTSSALVHMSDKWLQEMDKGNLVGAVLLDFSAAFDVVNHDILLAKLKCYGVVEPALGWFSSYLSNRTQTVFVNGSVSSHKECKSGVPQGSCLGPLLFCLYTNDLPTVVTQSDIVMYADDTTPSASGPSVEAIRRTLQSDLTRVWNWVDANRLVLNVGKTKSIVLGSRHKLKQNVNLQLSMGNQTIEQVEKAKLLGFLMDPQLSWDLQLDNVKTKMAGALATLKKS